MNKLLSVLSALIIAVILSWARPVLSHETVTTTVLFDREIVRILNSHCVMCHIDEGPAFPLVTYEQVWLQKRKISAAVIARHMPPWAAFSGYGRFANENVITLRTELDQATRRRAAAEHQMNEATAEQARVRENLKILRQGGDSYPGIADVFAGMNVFAGTN